MARKFKVIGLTKAKERLKQLQGETRTAISQINKTGMSLNIGGIKLEARVKDKNIKDFLSRLPQIIKKAHEVAVKGMVESLKIALNEAMESPVWDWNSDTRDIIDTGALRDSLKIYIDSDSDVHIFYGEDYAGIVHYGGYFHPYGNKTIKQYYPGRPWVTAVLSGGGPVDQFDFESEYKRLLEIELTTRLK